MSLNSQRQSVIVTVRERRALLNCFYEVLLAKIFREKFPNSNFFSKIDKKYVFWSTLLQFARPSDLETLT